ncbi:MAG TPA: prepilin-type N-terminal cleavage/methylation domain-containing protein [bacterium]|nr:prepilin-type N-terminal cleavage/methylation domain-containing protein [bacterium]
MIKQLQKIWQWMENDESGMTLIELIVAMTIVAILSAATVTILPYYRDQQLLKQGGLDLNDSLRYAQTLALEKDKNSEEFVVWKLVDDHKICVIDNKEYAVDPDCENTGQVYDFDKKLSVVAGLDELFFQGGTGNIYENSDFDTADLAKIQVAITHSNRSEVGDTYYGVKIAANSFGLMSSTINENSFDDLGGNDSNNEDGSDDNGSNTGSTTEIVCGDGQCTDNENYQNCPADCDQPIMYCGNDSCDYNESYTSCPNDCPRPVVCGDSYCDAGEENSCLMDCQVTVLGCTDRVATNFDSEANMDDGSCEYVYGCMDESAYNYNVKATKSDGSCEYGLKDGAACQLHTDCGSGNCTNGVCQAKLSSDQQCEVNSQCQSGTCGKCTTVLFWKFCYCE